MTDTARLTLTASAPRRYFAIGTMVALAILLVYVAFDLPGGGWTARLVLLGIAAIALWLAERQRRATLVTLTLTDTDLRSSDGTVIATLDEIAKVERGAFAFKPSNGFLLRTHKPGNRAWSPGMWWRVGRMIGVGGVCGASQTKSMAEAIALEVATREAATPD